MTSGWLVCTEKLAAMATVRKNQNCFYFSYAGIMSASENPILEKKSLCSAVTALYLTRRKTGQHLIFSN